MRDVVAERQLAQGPVGDPQPTHGVDRDARVARCGTVRDRLGRHGRRERTVSDRQDPDLAVQVEVRHGIVHRVATNLVGPLVAGESGRRLVRNGQRVVGEPDTAVRIGRRVGVQRVAVLTRRDLDFVAPRRSLADTHHEAEQPASVCRPHDAHPVTVDGHARVPGVLLVWGQQLGLAPGIAEADPVGDPEPSVVQLLRHDVHESRAVDYALLVHRVVDPARHQFSRLGDRRADGASPDLPPTVGGGRVHQPRIMSAVTRSQRGAHEYLALAAALRARVRGRGRSRSRSGRGSDRANAKPIADLEVE